MNRSGTVPVVALGTRIDIGYSSEAVGAELRRLLAPFLTGAAPSTSDGGVVRLAAGGTGDAQAVGELLAELNAAALDAANCLAVHAGAVCRDGQVIAFPGPSGIGKSTLAACCLRAGLDYVSDEALCLRWDTGAVLGYPRPLALSRWSAGRLGLAFPSTVDELLVTAGELGAAVAAGPLALAHVVLVDRSAGTAPATLEPAPRGAAVAELLRRSFTHWRDPDRAFTLVHQVLSAAAAWRLRLGDPTTAAVLLSELVGAGPGNARRSAAGGRLRRGRLR